MMVSFVPLPIFVMLDVPGLMFLRSLGVTPTCSSVFLSNSFESMYCLLQACGSLPIAATAARTAWASSCVSH